ncbi:MAG TPA: hypothetical protein VI488_15870 [Candidatus Angelobacter sp.]
MSQIAISPQDFAAPPIITRMRGRALTVGLVFSVLALVGAIWKWDIFLRAWLVAFMFWLGLTLGCMLLIMLQYTSGGNWGRLGRRFWEAAAGNLPFMFLCWLPIAVGMKVLYSWARMPHDVAVKELGPKAELYLTPVGFWVRGICFFLAWWLLIQFLLRWSKKEEAGQTTPAKFVTVQNVSGFGIVFYAWSITFASIDWAMSLDPVWWSTVWGMLFMVGEVLTALCFTIYLLAKLAPIEPLSRMFKVDYLHDYGKLMLTFVVLWAYLSFSQWLIIWSGNMLAEIRWYLVRLRGGWQYFGTVLIFVHFVFPFALLLSRNLKRDARRLVKIALLVIVMRLVDLFWQTAPTFYPAGDLSLMGWLDIAMYIICPIAIGGIWLFFFFNRLEKRSLMPVNDPHFVEMLEAKHG